MAGCWIVTCLCLTVTVASDTEALTSAWMSREADFPSVKVYWKVVRDSRTPHFDGKAVEPVDALWQLQVEGESIRVAGPRLAIVGRDDRFRPAVWDPRRARFEFQRILMEEQLDAKQPMPHWQSYSMYAPSWAQRPKNAFGKLEELLIEAPLLTVRPAIAGARQFVAVDRQAVVDGKSHAVFEETVSLDVQREYWVDAELEFRVSRIVERREGKLTALVQLDYAADEQDLPSSWTVSLYESNALIDFAVAQRVDLAELPPSVATTVDEAFHQDARSVIAPGTLQRTMQRNLRRVLDFLWIPGLLLVVLAAVRLGLSRKGAPAAAATSRKRSRLQPVLAALAVFVASLLARYSPVLDTTLETSYHDLASIWDRAVELHSRPADESQRAAFMTEASARLRRIATSIERSKSRWIRFEIWREPSSEERAAERARTDLLRLAKYEVPNVLRGQFRQQDQISSISERLTVIDDHLAGVNPFIPPKTTVPNRTQETVKPAANEVLLHLQSPLGMVIILAVQVIGLGLLFVYRAKRAAKSNRVMD